MLNSRSQPTVLRNESAGGPPLAASLDLVGVTTNRDGVGATVRVHGGRPDACWTRCTADAATKAISGRGCTSGSVSGRKWTASRSAGSAGARDVIEQVGVDQQVTVVEGLGRTVP